MRSTPKMVAWAAAGLVAVGGVSVGWYSVAGAPVDDQAARDAERVFCLSDQHRTQLTEAATNLRVIIPKDGLHNGPEFDRVCAAVVGAARIPQQTASVPAGTGKSTLDVLGSVVVGAFLAWLTGFWRDERTQSRLLADDLRNAARRYFSAVHVQRRKWFEGRKGTLPVDQPVLDGLDELVGQLRKVAKLRPGWTVPWRLVDQLSNGRLGERMNDPGTGESREQRDEALREILKTLGDSIDEVVGALERPWRWHGHMRTKHPTGAQ